MHSDSSSASDDIYNHRSHWKNIIPVSFNQDNTVVFRISQYPSLTDDYHGAAAAGG